MKTSLHSTTLITTLIAVSIFATACTQATNFAAGPVADLKQGLSTCQPGTTTKTLPTKFLFIVDQSGSNVDGPYEHPGQATDPTKAFRDGVISQFVNEQAGKANLSWGFIAFSGTSINAYINSSNPLVPAFSNIGAMNTALGQFMASTDVGDTPYRQALAAAHTLIQNDINVNGNAYQYRIAFLTDGYPTDYCPDPAATSCPTTMLESQIDTDITGIINLLPSSIQMSTVYYGLPDAVAEARLQRMAIDGKGQFVDTNVTKQITLDTAIQVPTTCQ